MNGLGDRQLEDGLRRTRAFLRDGELAPVLESHERGATEAPVSQTHSRLVDGRAAVYG